MNKELFKLDRLSSRSCSTRQEQGKRQRKLLIQLDKKSQEALEKIADNVDEAYPEESKEEKEKATKELVEKLSGQRVKTTDDLKDGSAIHKDS